MRVEQIPIDCIYPPQAGHRIESDPNELQALAQSIKSEGLINPITVKPIGNANYEVIAGDRRYQAMKMLGEAFIDCNINDDKSAHPERIKFAENNIRANLTPMEEALALTQMMDADDLDIDTLAKRVQRTTHWVESRLGLLQYPDELQRAVHDKDITLAAAAELARVTEPDHRAYLMQYAIASGASSNVLKQWRQQWELQQQQGGDEAAALPPLPDANQEMIITIPCAICGVAHPHTQSAILRTCKPCYHALLAEVQKTT